MAEREPPNWGEFDRPAPGPAPDTTGIAMLCARLFSGADGRDFIAWMRGETKERALPPNAPADALRHMEGQRWLCDKIERLKAAGEAAARAKK